MIAEEPRDVDYLINCIKEELRVAASQTAKVAAHRLMMNNELACQSHKFPLHGITQILEVISCLQAATNRLEQLEDELRLREEDKVANEENSYNRES